MKKIHLKCPGCGAVMTVNSEGTEAVCEYCHNRVLLQKEEQSENRTIIAEEKQGSRIGWYVLAAGVVFIAVTAAAAAYFKKPVLDPFAYVDVAFSGLNGEGEAKLTIQNGLDDNNLSGVRYTLEPKYNLSNGEYVSVSAETNEYRLTEETKKYQVSGLLEYLTDLDILMEEQIAIICAKNDEIQSGNLPLNRTDIHLVNEKLEPLKICLLTDGGNVNRLFVISKAELVWEERRKTHYLVSRMEDTVPFDGGISFGYSCCGGSLSSVVGEFSTVWLNSYASEEDAVASIRTSEPGMKYSEREL